MTKLSVIRGDITQIHTDAIVNAANNSLLGGGGVDGAIHREAGPELLKECRTLNGCGTGEAKITKGYNLPAKYVIHTVGPVWHGGNEREEELLGAAYLRCLELALQYGLETVAFPNIATGIYFFPKELAAGIAISTTQAFVQEHPKAFGEILFVCFDEENYSYYSARLK